MLEGLNIPRKFLVGKRREERVGGKDEDGGSGGQNGEVVRVFFWGQAKEKCRGRKIKSLRPIDKEKQGVRGCQIAVGYTARGRGFLREMSTKTGGLYEEKIYGDKIEPVKKITQPLSSIKK